VKTDEVRSSILSERWHRLYFMLWNSGRINVVTVVVMELICQYY